MQKQVKTGRLQPLLLKNPLYLRPSVAGDRAFISCERMYDELFAGILSIRILKKLYDNDRIHLAFKKELLDLLASIHHLELLHQKVKETIGEETKQFIIPFQWDLAWKYRRFKKEMKRIDNSDSSFSCIHFPIWAQVAGAIRTFCQKVIWAVYLFYSVALCTSRRVYSILMARRKHEVWDYAIALRSPLREMANRVRGFDFLLDGKQLRIDNTLFIPIASLTSEHREWV